MRISVTVKPGSRHESVVADADGALTIRVNAPPVEGRANERVIELLAKHLGRPKSAIRLVRGAKGKKKSFEVT